MKISYAKTNLDYEVRIRGQLTTIKGTKCHHVVDGKRNSFSSLSRLEIDLRCPFKSDIALSYQMMIAIHEFIISNPSACCFVFDFSGYMHLFYYPYRYLSWLNLEVNVSLTYVFLERHFELTYLETQMEMFIKHNCKTGKPSLFGKFDICRENECYKTSEDKNVIAPDANIDVVIPTKGVTFEEVERCVTSVVSSLKRGDTIVVIDDNNQEMRELKNLEKLFKQVEVFPGPKEGVASARNLGITKGDNPLVLFVDSDDFVLPSFVELQRKMHYANDQVCATGTWLRAFGSHRTVYPQWDNLSPLSVVNCLPPAGVLMWKRQSLRTLGGFDTFFKNGFEDFDLISRATAENREIYILDLPLYMYQRGQHSLSQTWDWDLESKLKGRVASNANNLCKHKSQQLFEVIMQLGNSIFLTSPDFFDKKLSNLRLVRINRLRNRWWLRAIWRRIPIVIREYLWRKIILR